MSHGRSAGKIVVGAALIAAGSVLMIAVMPAQFWAAIAGIGATVAGVRLVIKG